MQKKANGENWRGRRKRGRHLDNFDTNRSRPENISVKGQPNVRVAKQTQRYTRNPRSSKPHPATYRVALSEQVDGDGDVVLDTAPLRKARRKTRRDDERDCNRTLAHSDIDGFMMSAAIQRPRRLSCTACSTTKRKIWAFRGTLHKLHDREKQEVDALCRSTGTTQPQPEPMDWQPEIAMPVHIITTIPEQLSYYEAFINHEPSLPQVLLSPACPDARSRNSSFDPANPRITSLLSPPLSEWDSADDL
jgi:hypothetical protein